MTKFVNTEGINYNLDGSYIEPTNQFNVQISSTYTECRFPDEKRRLFQATLTRKELDDLIVGLIAIRDSGPKQE